MTTWFGSLRVRACAALLGLALLATAFAARTVTAQVITFETTPAGLVPVDDDPLSPFTPYSIGGVQVAFGFDLNSDLMVETPAEFERVGGPNMEPETGFIGSNGPDQPDTGFALQLGQWFLRGPTTGINFGRFVITYTSPFPVVAASGEIWDIDGLPDPMNPSNPPYTEEYTVQAYDASNNLLATQVSPLGTLPTATAPLDGKPWTFAFSGLSAGIDHIVVTFTGTKPAGIGLAFNNFRPLTVPEPSGMALAAMGAVALVRRRRRA
jgi:MYXO-CTERM domain-containing protein